MKIVNKTPHRSVVKQAICRHCGVTVEYVPNDVKTRTWKDYTGESSGEEYLECPNCNKKIVVRCW